MEDRVTKMLWHAVVASERSERDTLRSVQSRIEIPVCVIVCMSHLPFDP